MEIKAVDKEKIEYPKMNEISNKKLKNCIPNKWTKLGITPLIFGIIMKNKVFATSFDEILNTSTAGVLPFEEQVLAGDIAVLAGGIAVIDPIPIIYRHITLGTIIMFVISLIGLLITRSKINKEGENGKIRKLKKIFKILLIIAIAIFVISSIIYMFYKLL